MPSSRVLGGETDAVFFITVGRLDLPGFRAAK